MQFSDANFFFSKKNYLKAILTFVTFSHTIIIGMKVNYKTNFFKIIYYGKDNYLLFLQYIGGDVSKNYIVI